VDQQGNGGGGGREGRGGGGVRGGEGRSGGVSQGMSICRGCLNLAWGSEE